MTPVIHTFTGKDLNPLALKITDICIEDITHGLSLCNRFAGQTKKPISVAQHSLFVSHLCNGTGFELQALLHDASEAFIGDMTKWFKESPQMKHYREIEKKIQHQIFKRFDCPLVVQPCVEYADRVMVRFEAMKGFGKGFKINHPNYPPLTHAEIKRVGIWGFWGWRTSQMLFLERFYNLMQGL